jgi:hypothetical protein
MKTLIAIPVTLAIALGVAVPAVAASAAPGGDASSAQYSAPSSGLVPVGDQTRTPTTPPGESAPQGGAVPVGEETPVASPTSPTTLANAAGGEGELPFTGYLVLGILGAGLLVLTAGVALRRATGTRETP